MREVVIAAISNGKGGANYKKVIYNSRVIFYIRRIGLYLYKYGIYGTTSIYSLKGLVFVYQPI